LFEVIVARKQSVHQIISDIDVAVRTATLTAMTNASDDIQSSGRDVQRDWRHKVSFGETVTMDARSIEVLIKPTGANVRIWTYVDKGTKGPYLIPKVVIPGKVLRFQPGYSARTAPVALYNRGTGQHFGNWVSKQQVQHPGIKKREFLKTFMEKLIPSLQVRVQMQINQAVS
jgi:hypothetical protein